MTPRTHTAIWLLIVSLFLGTAMFAAPPTLCLAEDVPAPEAVSETEPAAEAEAAVEAEAVEEEASGLALLGGDVDVLWTCLAAFLVFFMQAGFALVECGFTRAKNACNIIMKNLMDFSLGTILFWMIGFGLMFGISNGFCGTNGFFFDAGESSFDWAFLIFQTVFCATAATIVSGAMAERTKFSSYLIYTVGITAIVYPIFGSWAWNGLYSDGGWLEAPEGGFLANMGLPCFVDFAGSTVVHSVGGWAALAGAIVLGPRIGKYTKKGIVPIPGHNIPLAALGVFILWLGWFGFNPGSTTAVGGGNFAYVAVVTNISAAAGAVAALIASWVAFKKPDPSFSLNGALAGLVAITAGCYNMSPVAAALTGLCAGVIVVGSCVFFDRIRIDDPVGAISVHGVCGAFGTIAVGLWGCNVWNDAGWANYEGIGLLNGGGVAQLMTQLIGVGAGFLWAFFVSLGIFLAIKYTVGLRVSAEEEIEGLDMIEHGMYAYPPAIVSGSPNSGLAGSQAGSYSDVSKPASDIA